MDNIEKDNSTLHNIKENPLLDIIDWDKFLFILNKFSILLIALFLTAFMFSYSIIRWTNPIYRAVARIQIESQTQEVRILGGEALAAEKILQENDLRKEIAIITSSVLANAIIDSINLSVRYYKKGEVSSTEYFKNMPFRVEYEVYDSEIYNKKFDIEILNQREFILSYQYPGGNYNMLYEFGESINNERFSMTIYPTVYFNTNSIGNYFFSIHNQKKLISFIKSNLSAYIENDIHSVNISFEDSNKERALLIINLVFHIYEKIKIDSKNKRYIQALNYLRDQLKVARDTINIIRRELSAYPPTVRYYDDNYAAIYKKYPGYRRIYNK